MERWQILATIGGVSFGAAMLRFLWGATVHTRESISATPGMGGYVPNGRWSRGGNRGDRGAERGLPDVDDHKNADTAVGDENRGTWIELDIEPLFKSSDRAPVAIVDLTEENEPEASA